MAVLHALVLLFGTASRDAGSNTRVKFWRVHPFTRRPWKLLTLMTATVPPDLMLDMMMGPEMHVAKKETQLLNRMNADSSLQEHY